MSISAALALLNMVPAYYLDGQWALFTLIELAAPAWPGARKEKVARGVLVGGSALLLASIVLSMWSAVAA